MGTQLAQDRCHLLDVRWRQGNPQSTSVIPNFLKEDPLFEEGLNKLVFYAGYPARTVETLSNDKDNVHHFVIMDVSLHQLEVVRHKSDCLSHRVPMKVQIRHVFRSFHPECEGPTKVLNYLRTNLKAYPPPQNIPLGQVVGLVADFILVELYIVRVLYRMHPD